MAACCSDFEKRVQNSQQDGFWIYRSLWMLPYKVQMFLLCCQIGDQKQSVRINYCPWCGASLEAKQDEPSEWLRRASKLSGQPSIPFAKLITALNAKV